MTLGVCIECGDVADGTRCPDCLTAYDRRRGGAHARGYNRAWERVARSTKRRQTCCLRCGAWSDLTVDHIVPKVRGGTDDEENLQVLCRRCNSAKGPR